MPRKFPWSCSFYLLQLQYVPAVPQSYMPEVRSVRLLRQSNPQILPEIQKNILPDKLKPHFLPRSLSSISFLYFYYFFHRNQCRAKNLYVFFIHYFSQKIYIFPESQLTVRCKDFKICIIHIYKQSRLPEVRSEDKKPFFFCVLQHFLLFHPVFLFQKYIYDF